jgi:hypothetical protein
MEGQTTQWPKEKGQKDTQRSTKIMIYKTWHRKLKTEQLKQGETKVIQRVTHVTVMVDLGRKKEAARI